MRLNNWLQGRYGNTNHLTWEQYHYGLENSGYWVAIAFCADFSAVNVSLSGTDLAAIYIS
jgi:hypothetical protein